MTPDARRPRRDGWPWPAAPQPSLHDDCALRATEAVVHTAALAVGRLSGELTLALRRLEEALAEAQVASEQVAARKAIEAIDHARRRPD
jgi:hypothetical protein